MKKYFSAVFFGFLSAYSITVSFHFPFQPENFPETVDYITASIYEILGQYSFSFILIWLLCIGFFVYIDKKGYSVLNLFSKDRGKKDITSLVLSIIFAFSLTLGIFFSQVDTYIVFGSLVNYLKAFFAIVGFTLLFYPALLSFNTFFDKLSITEDNPNRYGKKTFFKVFLFLVLFYLPFLIVSFPGNLCYDSIGQINQVINNNYTAHHPLVHTLILGGFVKLGMKLFGSMEIGLFVYTVLQTVFLLICFSICICFFAKKNVKKAYIRIMMLIFCITPLYTNLATTAIKDIPYASFCLLFLIAYSLAVTKPEYVRNPKFHIVFVLLQIGVILTRNNGLPLVVLSGVAAFLYICFKKNKISVIILSALAFFAESAIIGVLSLNLLGNALNSENVSKGEMLSLPFQQTAYYLLESDDVTESEILAIEKVLGNGDTIKENYDPKIADPVKALFNKGCSNKDLIEYMKAYFKMGLRHPSLYIKAFLVHTYGWYSPAVTLSIRYENDMEKTLLFPGADKVMIFLYRFAGRFSPLAVLENIGVSVWFLLILTVYLIKNKKGFMITIPLWVSFLVCLSSPCFYNHSRYALPILCGVPFLYYFTKTNLLGSAKQP